MASIKIELDDGTNTWVTLFPVPNPTLDSALRTAGLAFVWFIAGLQRDQDAVTEHLLNEKEHVHA